MTTNHAFDFILFRFGEHLHVLIGHLDNEKHVLNALGHVSFRLFLHCGVVGC